jgi:hypothetical protein
MAGTMITLTYPLVIRFGLLGGQLAALVAVIAGLSFQVVRLRTLTSLDSAGYLRVVLVFGGISLVVGLVAFCLSTLVPAQGIVSLVLGPMACIVAWAFGLLAILRTNAKLAV